MHPVPLYWKCSLVELWKRSILGFGSMLSLRLLTGSYTNYLCVLVTELDAEGGVTQKKVNIQKSLAGPISGVFLPSFFSSFYYS